MKMQILAVRDIKADVYGVPMFVPNIAAALRNFADQVNDPESGMLNKHPEDFELYHLGSYDDTNAVFVTDDLHYENGEQPFERRRLALASDFKKA